MIATAGGQDWLGLAVAAMVSREDGAEVGFGLLR